MVQLADSDIQTHEVLDWRGVHLLHFQGSSCSQKTRIVLNLKRVEWTSHPVDIAIKKENTSPWFLGINPRGLVPVLVHDGVVHIESNDVIRYIDESFDGPKLIPIGFEGEVEKLLAAEDAIHLDLRNLTLRFLAPKAAVEKSAEQIARYRSEGSGTVRGEVDPDKQREIDFWEMFARRGITDDMVCGSVETFQSAFADFESRLATQPYLLGADLSLVDIAWFIYAARVRSTGYPLAELHPRVDRWFEGFAAQSEFADEIESPLPIRLAAALVQLHDRLTGRSLRKITGI